MGTSLEAVSATRVSLGGATGGFAWGTHAHGSPTRSAHEVEPASQAVAAGSGAKMSVTELAVASSALAADALVSGAASSPLPDADFRIASLEARVARLTDELAAERAARKAMSQASSSGSPAPAVASRLAESVELCMQSLRQLDSAVDPWLRRLNAFRARLQSGEIASDQVSASLAALVRLSDDDVRAPDDESVAALRGVATLAERLERLEQLARTLGPVRGSDGGADNISSGGSSRGGGGGGDDRLATLAAHTQAVHERMVSELERLDAALESCRALADEAMTAWRRATDRKAREARASEMSAAAARATSDLRAELQPVVEDVRAAVAEALVLARRSSPSGKASSLATAGGAALADVRDQIRAIGDEVAQLRTGLQRLADLQLFLVEEQQVRARV